MPKQRRSGQNGAVLAIWSRREISSGTSLRDNTRGMRGGLLLTAYLVESSGTWELFAKFVRFPLRRCVAHCHYGSCCLLSTPWQGAPERNGLSPAKAGLCRRLFPAVLGTQPPHSKRVPATVVSRWTRWTGLVPSGQGVICVSGTDQDKIHGSSVKI